MNDISLNSLVSMSDKALSELTGNFIKHHRLNQNKTQNEVSSAASISRSTLSLLERGGKVTLMGALEFEPAQFKASKQPFIIEIKSLVDIAQKMLSARKGLMPSIVSLISFFYLQNYHLSSILSKTIFKTTNYFN